MDRTPLRKRAPAWVTLVRGVVLGGALVLAVPSRPAAHEIPADVTVRVLVKAEVGRPDPVRPDGGTLDRDRLSILVRVPLVAMRDVQLPVHGPLGLMDLSSERLEPVLRSAARLWIADYLTVYEGGSPVDRGTVARVRVSRPTDRSFGEWDTALDHVISGFRAGDASSDQDIPDDAVSGAHVSAETRLASGQALLDVLLEYPIRSAGSDFALEPELAHLGIRTTTVLHFYGPGGEERLYQYVGDPGLVRLDPRWHHAALRFVVLGFDHILDGLDHLLFLLCLVAPVLALGPLVAVVTSFTVAHSITLGASVLGVTPDALWFPALVETLIALSIVWMALENVVVAFEESGSDPILERRWMLAFGFGLVHGFGFSFALAESLQFAGAHLATSLLSFNVGVELGQLAVLALLVPALAYVFGHLVSRRAGVIVVSVLVAHTGWHWMTDRGADFLRYDLTWPTVDLFFLAGVMRWAALALVVGAALWLLRGLYERLFRGPMPVAAEGRGP